MRIQLIFSLLLLPAITIAQKRVVNVVVWNQNVANKKISEYCVLVDSFPPKSNWEGMTNCDSVIHRTLTYDSIEIYTDPLGTKTGFQYIYNEDGVSLKKKIFWERGGITQYFEYYSNGNIKTSYSDCKNSSGIITSRNYFEFFENGQLSETYSDTLIYGKRSPYLLNGKELSIQFNSYLIHGAKVKYYLNGNVEEISQFQLGKKEGYTFMFNDKGKLVKTTLFRQGKKVK